MVFLKQLSDTWDDERAIATAEWGGELTDEIASNFRNFDLPTERQSNKLLPAAETYRVLI